MSVDNRGIRRGQCNECGSGCGGYSKDSGGVKCICGHPPGKHVNLNLSSSLASATGGQTSQTYAQAATSGQYGGYPPSTYRSAGNYGYSDPQHHAYSNSQHHAYSNSQHHAYSNSQHHAYSHHYYVPQPPANLPKCRATGCPKPVHWEPDVEGDFDYCSPECRNKHLLPIEKEQLKKELEKLAEQLRTAAVADVSNRPKHTTSASGSNGKTKQQKTVRCFFQKSTGKDLGFVINEEMYSCDGSQALLVTGVVIDTTACNKMRCDLRLLDVITHVNQQPVCNLQKSFDDATRDLGSVSLVLDRSIALPSISKLISDVDDKAKKFRPPPTHILVLRNPHHLRQDDFGISIAAYPPTQGLVVSGVTDKTIARQSGLKVNDEIQMYALATQSDIDEIQTTTSDDAFRAVLKFASTTGKSVVLVIMRRTQKTTTV